MNRLVLGTIGVIFGISTYAGAVKAADLSVCPYVGMEIGIKHMSFKSSEMSGLKKNGPKARIIAGFRFHEFFGLEFGAGFHKAKSVSKINTRSLSAALTAFYPLTDSVKVVGLAGVSQIKAKFIDRLILDMKTEKSKAVPFVSLALQHNFAEGFDVRASVCLHHAKKLKNALNLPKNSMSYNVGLIYSF